jgi:hypothetical protein
MHVKPLIIPAIKAVQIAIEHAPPSILPAADDLPICPSLV